MFKLVNFNNVIRGYLFISIICYLFYLIAPIVTLIMNTQVYSFQRYLAILGIVIIGYDLLFFRIGFKTKYSILFYFLVGIACISSFMTIEYGFKDNLFDIIWFIIYVYIYYSYAERVGLEQVKRDIDKVYTYVAVIWLVAVLLSVLTYLFNIEYRILANPYNNYLTRQGFMENRLFGVFMTLIISAILSGLLIIYGSLRYPKKKRVIFANFIFFSHILLSGSRGALLSLLLLIMILIFYKGLIRYFVNKSIISKVFLSALLSISLTSGLFLGIQVLKSGLAYLPTFSIFTNNSIEYKTLLSKYPNVVVIQEGLEGTVDKRMVAEELLDRKDVDASNVSNGRLEIWKDYIGLYNDIFILGLSSSNYSKYIQENYHDLFIVQFVKNNHPDTYNIGGVYHPHNTYLMIYTATGVLGLVVFMLILVLLTKYTIIKLFKQENSYLLLVMSIVLFCLINGLFDSVLIFSNEIVTCIFWIFLGVLARMVKEK